MNDYISYTYLTFVLLHVGSGPGRRGSVSSSAVTVEANWSPPRYEKSAVEKTKIRSVLDRNVLFMGLDDVTKGIIVDAMAKRRFPAVSFPTFALDARDVFT